VTDFVLPISVVFLTYNDERLIEEGLQSILGWVDEIYVVDSGSTDGTLEIVRRYTDKIITHPFENYAAQRRWAQANLPLANEWVFHIDSDERVTPELCATLQNFFAGSDADQVDGVMFPRRTVFMGRWIRHGGHYPVYHVRLFRKTKGQCEDRLYDQHFTVEGKVIKVSGDLIDVISTSLESWTLRHVRWAGLEVQQQLGNGATNQVQEKLDGTPIEQRRWLKTFIFGRTPLFLRVFAYFFYRYFFRLGFLDGTEGLIFHFLQGCWFRFYIDAKIWEAKNMQGKVGSV